MSTNASLRLVVDGHKVILERFWIKDTSGGSLPKVDATWNGAYKVFPSAVKQRETPCYEKKSPYRVGLNKIYVKRPKSQHPNILKVK